MPARCPAVSSPPHSLAPHTGHCTGVHTNATNGGAHGPGTRKSPIQVLLLRSQPRARPNAQCWGCKDRARAPSSRNGQSGRVRAGTCQCQGSVACLVPLALYEPAALGPPWALVFPPTLRPSVTLSKADSRTSRPGLLPQLQADGSMAPWTSRHECLTST